VTSTGSSVHYIMAPTFQTYTSTTNSARIFKICYLLWHPSDRDEHAST